MSYCIKVSDIDCKLNGGGWVNKTWEVIKADFKLLDQVFNDGCFQLDSYDAASSDEEKMIAILESEYMDEMKGFYLPELNYVQLLQRASTDKQIAKIFGATTNVVVIIDDDGNQYIGMSGCGIGVEEEIAYTYMVIDGEVPSSFINEIYIEKRQCLSVDAFNELLHFTRYRIRRQVG
jgi:hypothetical protein